MHTKRKRTYERHNIWRSYSDLLAGLLLLFVLVMCVSFMEAQKNYQENLANEARYQLTESQLQSMLAEQQAQLDEQQSELDEQAVLLAAQQSDLEEQSALVTSQQASLNAQSVLLTQQESELADKSALVSEQEAAIDEQAALVAEQEAALAEQSVRLSQQESELAEQSALVATQQASLEEQEELMAIQQEKIEQIIGVKADLIEALKEEFDELNLAVTVDETDGSIALDSSVLFGYNENELTDEGNELLGEVLPVYCEILTSEDYIDYLAEIRIDGYTDTSGSYEYNLMLSQERARAVADYLLSLSGDSISEDEMSSIQELLSVNGHSWANPVYDERGRVDADASRRVEIKFRLKDEEMIDELKDIMEDTAMGTAAVKTSAANGTDNDN